MHVARMPQLCKMAPDYHGRDIRVRVAAMAPAELASAIIKVLAAR
jgi:hypothetical protein